MSTEQTNQYTEGDSPESINAAAAESSDWDKIQAMLRNGELGADHDSLGDWDWNRFEKTLITRWLKNKEEFGGDADIFRRSRPSEKKSSTVCFLEYFLSSYRHCVRQGNFPALWTQFTFPSIRRHLTVRRKDEGDEGDGGIHSVQTVNMKSYLYHTLRIPHRGDDRSFSLDTDWAYYLLAWRHCNAMELIYQIWKQAGDGDGVCEINKDQIIEIEKQLFYKSELECAQQVWQSHTQRHVPQSLEAAQEVVLPSRASRRRKRRRTSNYQNRSQQESPTPNGRWWRNGSLWKGIGISSIFWICFFLGKSGNGEAPDCIYQI